MMTKLALSIALLLTFMPPAAGGGVYKWVDDKGKVHYGDRPPAQGAAQIDVEKSPAPKPTPPTIRKDDRQLRRQLEAFEERRARRRRDAEMAKMAKERRRYECALARERKRPFTQGKPVWYRDEDGERVYLSDAEWKATVKKADEAIEKWCDEEPKTTTRKSPTRDPFGYLE